MAREVDYPSGWRLLGFLIAIIIIIVASLFYEETLFDSSEDFIKKIQHNKEGTFKVTFFWIVSKCTGGGAYAGLILMLLPFISRERFWYYLLIVQFQSFIVALGKFSFHDPRPPMVWKGIMDTGCSTSFGNPSGHSLEAANFPLVIILDHFVASNWSRETYPKLNTWTIKKNPIAFIIILVLSLCFWPLIVYDRLFLGKHTFN